MTVHTRRAALAALATAAAATPLLVATRSAFAQTAPTAAADPQAYADYVTQTLTLGTVALQTSQIAMEKAENPLVKEFAQLEVGEQTAIATVLSSTGAQPPALPPEQQQMVQQMQDMEAGPEFDNAYLQAQIQGHQQLLQVQQTISGGMEATVEVITAKLAEQAITSHMAMLNHLQTQMGGATGATAAPPAGGDAAATTTTTEAPAGGDATATTTAAPAGGEATTTTTTAPAGGDATATTTAAPAGGEATTTTTAAPAGGEATTTTTAAPAGGGAAATTTTAQ